MSSKRTIQVADNIEVSLRSFVEFFGIMLLTALGTGLLAAVL